MDDQRFDAVVKSDSSSKLDLGKGLVIEVSGTMELSRKVGITYTDGLAFPIDRKATTKSYSFYKFKQEVTIYKAVSGDPLADQILRLVVPPHNEDKVYDIVGFLDVEYRLVRKVQ